jgi:PAS domain S-box-containing protein
MASILVVEDEKIVAADIQSTLTSLGYSVPLVVSSGEEAVRRVLEIRPDLVLMDIMLDGQMDGVQAARVMRQRFSVPVVFLTAYADSDSLSRARASDPFGYVVKPFSEKELRTTIEIALYKHQVERQLEERERWVSTTLRCVGDAVIATDPHEKVTFLNPAAESLTGRKTSEVVGCDLKELLRVRKRETVSHSENGPPSGLQGLKPAEHFVMIGKQGREIFVESRAAPIIDANDVLLGTVVVLRDVTERKRTERRLLLADRLASLGVIAAGVAHEVNNPLTYVIGNVGFAIEEIGSLGGELQRSTDSAAPVELKRELMRRMSVVLDALDECREGAERVHQIMKDLSTFSRGGEDHRSLLNLHQVLEASLKMTHNQIRHRARVVRDMRSIPLVQGNPAELGQVFVNLLVNAAEAITEGSVEKNEIRIVTRTDEQGRAAIEIHDTGSGIPGDALNHIFDPFFTTKPVGVGVGLGLAICQQIVSGLEGDISVESELGRGSMFRVILPAAADQRRAPTFEPRSVASPASGGKVLVVDDEPIVGASIRRTLAKEHEVVVVSSGREALSLIAAGHSFDLVLSDVMMPEMSGIDLYHELSRISPRVAQRMVFLTGGAFTPGARRFLDSVPNQRLEKPFDPDKLRDFVRERIN